MCFLLLSRELVKKNVTIVSLWGRVVFYRLFYTIFLICTIVIE